MTDGTNYYDGAEGGRVFREALKTGNPARIASVANDYLWALATHDHTLLMDAIARLPADILGKYDGLILVHPMAPTLARSGLLVPVNRIPPYGHVNDEPTHQERLVRRMIAYRMTGDLSAAADFADRLIERLGQQRVPSMVELTGPIPQFYVHVATTYLLAGQTRKALVALSIARQLAEHAPLPHVQREASAKAAMIKAFRGSHAEASGHLVDARSLPDVPVFHQPVVVRSERIAEAITALEEMTLEAESFARSLDSVDSRDELWPFVVLVRARLAMAASRPSQALESVHHAAATHPAHVGSVASDISGALEIEAFVELGDVAAAEEVHRKIQRPGPLVSLARMKLLIHQGDLTEAGQEYRRIVGASDVAPAVRDHAMLYSAWMRFIVSGTVDEVQAESVANALDHSHRRILTTVPKSFVQAVAGRLSEESGLRFEQLLDGLRFSRPSMSAPQLTAGELKVLRAAQTHFTVSEIAKALFLSPNTVKTQLKTLYKKLGVDNRADALTVAVRVNLLAWPDATKLNS
ncbi:response regulator transcription factor [Arthrobacter sp. RAF14]|uniref:helix-turn-helix transcriptional regulator n=1 Tax=Arthrobacter sp. RAF14 TaxID=3233051 RepID=UPI003F92E06C